MGIIEEDTARLREALEKKHSIVIAARCEVWYSGRAESYLQAGDRIIIIKEDRSLIIHQPSGNNPVNYMKPGTSLDISSSEGCFFLNSRNLASKEYLDIRLHKIHFLDAMKLDDSHSIVISGTEDDMAEMLYSSPDLIEKGFRAVGREEQTKYGFVDLLGYDREGKLTVVECKRYTADLNAVTQLRRYVEKIEKSKGIKGVGGILASPRISPNALNMLRDWGFRHISVRPPKYLERYDKKQQRLDLY